MISTLLLGFAVVVSTPRPLGPCDLLDRATVGSILGRPVTDVKSSAPARDEDIGGTLSFCTYRAGAAALIVSQITFANAAAAQKATTKELVEGQMDDEVTAFRDVSGVGDRAFWAATETGAEFVILKGAIVLGVSLGGSLPKPPASYEAALRAAASAAAAKL
ncbi:MAG TPA: hypothetical protein VGQ18_01520 [Gemmatimonadales bacterium]|jgi:subtilisin family serine protease|nr:hypothetical protein [Gemmatimonadales bacterium]